MFDDDQPQQAGNVPGNLPMGEPEDIFSNTPDAAGSPSSAVEDAEPAAPPVTPVAPDASDVVPAQKTALDAGVLQPKNTPAPPAEPVAPMNQPMDAMPPVQPMTPAAPSMSPQMTTPPPPMQPNAEQTYTIREPLGNRRVMGWVILAIVVVVLGVGSMWIYFSIIKSDSNTDNFYVPDTINTNANTTTVTPDQTQTLPVTDNNSETNGAEDVSTTDNGFDINEQILLGEPLDTDGDGLDDVREADIKTDPLNWDTDGDALGDGDEVTIWKTDPLDPDTDNDGYLDGAEIKNGYNPAGPGKLFEPPTPTSTL